MYDLNIGVDIVENFRLGNTKLLKRFLSAREFKVYQTLIDRSRKLQYAASRWAGKESIIKASSKAISWNEIEILNDESGRTVIYVNAKIRNDIKLSISHEEKYTVAFCLFIGQ